jgi:hypothetical protein
MKMEHHLVGGSSIVLEYAYSVGLFALSNSIGNSFHDLEKTSDFFVWGFMDILIMLSGYHQSVALIDGSRIQKGNYFPIIINETCLPAIRKAKSDFSLSASFASKRYSWGIRLVLRSFFA